MTPKIESPIAESNHARLTRSGASTPRLARLVYEQLHRLIMRGDFPQGCKLPPEGELCVRFGVSRPVLREALQHLANDGYVRSRRGSGSVVVRGELPGPRSLPPIRTIADLLRSYEYRIHVERETARLAAERRTQANLDEITRALDEADRALKDGMFQLMGDLNFAFHRSVARATQNAYYLATLEMIPNFIGFDYISQPSVNSVDVAERMTLLYDEHRSIFAAIRNRDGERASAEIARHIGAARDRVLELQRFAFASSSAELEPAVESTTL